MYIPSKGKLMLSLTCFIFLVKATPQKRRGLLSSIISAATDSIEKLNNNNNIGSEQYISFLNSPSHHFHTNPTTYPMNSNVPLDSSVLFPIHFPYGENVVQQGNPVDDFSQAQNNALVLPPDIPQIRPIFTSNCKYKSCFSHCQILTSNCQCRNSISCFHGNLYTQSNYGPSYYQPQLPPPIYHYNTNNNNNYYNNNVNNNYNNKEGFCLKRQNNKKPCGRGQYCYTRKCCRRFRSYRGYRYQCSHLRNGIYKEEEETGITTGGNSNI